MNRHAPRKGWRISLEKCEEEKKSCPKAIMGMIYAELLPLKTAGKNGREVSLCGDRQEEKGKGAFAPVTI